MHNFEIKNHKAQFILPTQIVSLVACVYVPMYL